MVFFKETCLILYLLPANLSLTSDTLCQWGHRRLYGPPLSEPPGSMCEGVWRESVCPPLLGQCGFYEPAFLRKLPRCLLQTLMLGATAFLETLHSVCTAAKNDLRMHPWPFTSPSHPVLCSHRTQRVLWEQLYFLSYCNNNFVLKRIFIPLLQYIHAKFKHMYLPRSCLCR